MNVRGSYIAMMIAIAVLGGAACTSQKSADEQKRVDELQAQLDDAKQQLAAKEESKSVDPAATEAAAPGGTAVAPGARVAAPRTGAAPGRARGAAVPAHTAAAQGPATADSDAQRQASAAEERRLNETQAQADRVQQQIAELTPIEYTIPAGTVIPVRTTRELSTSHVADGSVFDAVLEKALVVDGTVLAARGARVAGVVVSSDPGGRVKGVASLDVTIRSIAGRKDHTIGVKADSYSVVAGKSIGRDAKRTGIMTGAGAIVGAIAGGGKGAAIGAGAGAGTGVAATMATRGVPAVIPSETLMEFRLASPSTVTYQR